MKISLLENTYSFLEEALSKAIAAEKEPSHWKFAAFNLVQSIELTLKEKLRREHPILIFQKIDAPKNTVTLNTALDRLEKIVKISITESDKSTISKASKLRNNIVHFEFDLNTTEIKLIFAKLLGFISQFHSIHLDSPLDKIIRDDLWTEAVSIFEYADELFKRAEKIFEEKEIDTIFSVWTCPNCEWEAFVIQDDEDTCYVCGYHSKVIQCSGCESLFFENDCHELQTGKNNYKLFCTECYEDRIKDDDRYYHEMMAHFWGK